MPTIKLTDRYLQTVENNTRQRFEVWDAVVLGLGLRVSPTGHRSWCLVERRLGKQFRTTLGRYPNVTLQEARTLARTKLGQSDTEFSAERAADAVSLSVRQLADEFEREHLQRNRSGANQWRYLERDFLPAFASSDIRAVELRAIASRLNAVAKDHGPHAAANSLKVVRRFMGWCVEKGVIEQNPSLGIKLRTPSQSRERVLTDAEVIAFWQSANDLGYPFGTAFQLMLVTGQRRSEVSKMRWSDLIDAEWTIPADIAKNGRVHLVPLTALALQIIGSCPVGGAGPYVFSTTNGRVPISGFSKSKRALDAQLGGNAEWRLHDLRRTVATNMAKLGVRRDVIGRCLNHQIAGVTSVYDRYSYTPEIRIGLAQWADRLSKMCRLIRPA